MALLVVAGVVNLLWIATMIVFVLVEKGCPVATWGALITLSRVRGG